MEIVIELHEGVIHSFDHEEQWSALLVAEMRDILRRGTPLPKGHGKLVDADEIMKRYKEGNWDLHKVLRSAPAIIEADKEES